MRRIAGLLLLFPMLRLGATREQAQSPPSPAGTYTFDICRGGCGPRDQPGAYLRGTLILLDSVIPVPESWGRYHPNACFQLTQIRPQEDSYAGIWKHGLTVWQRADSGHGISLILYRSPDAGYDADLRVMETELRGSGGSWGTGVAEIHAPRDSIVARRVGPPNPGSCRKWLPQVR